MNCIKSLCCAVRKVQNNWPIWVFNEVSLIIILKCKTLCFVCSVRTKHLYTILVHVYLLLLTFLSLFTMKQTNWNLSWHKLRKKSHHTKKTLRRRKLRFLGGIVWMNKVRHDNQLFTTSQQPTAFHYSGTKDKKKTFKLQNLKSATSTEQKQDFNETSRLSFVFTSLRPHSLAVIYIFWNGEECMNIEFLTESASQTKASHTITHVTHICIPVWSSTMYFSNNSKGLESH